MATDEEDAANLSDKNLAVIPKDVLQKCCGIRILDLSKNEGIQLDNALGSFKNITRLQLNRCALLAIPDEICELKQLEELDLSSNWLSSGLNPALRQLQHLKKLLLENCELTCLPDWIGDLQQLEELNLFRNKFDSGLNSAIGRLCLLKKLNIGRCALKATPEWIEDLQQLEELDLSSNWIPSDLNPVLRQLRRLRKLLLEYCNLKIIPDWIGDLQQLEELSLAQNEFHSGLNPAIGRLRLLKKLYISKCKLTNAPEWVGDLEQLEELDLSSNELSTGLNPALRQLRQLKRLRLDDCKLTSLPDWIEDLQKLEELSLFGNWFSSGLNPAMRQLRLIKKLDLRSCKLASLPDWIGDLQQLEVLSLCCNKFSSGLNPGIGRLRLLKTLNLQRCKLTSLPDSIGDLHQLQWLSFVKNKFTSGLNPAIGRLRLKGLFLENCKLTTLPDSIGDLQQLEVLSLREDDFTCGLNPAIGRLHLLKWLFLYCCKLTNLPDWIGDLQQLEGLSLRGVELTSGLHPAIGRLRLLKWLTLNNCQLTTLPDSIGDLHQLENLYLELNEFSGGLNPAVGRLRNLKALNVHSCKLTSLPDSIGDLEQLEVLILGIGKQSRFSNLRKTRHERAYQRPPYFRYEKELEATYMRSNNFSDGLNPAIGRLKRLEFLVLDGCKLTNLPDSIEHLEQLETLSLKSNRLEDYPRCTLRLKKMLNIDLSNDFNTYGGNQLRTLPVELAYSSIEELNLDGNPITEPPMEIWSQGATAVRSFMLAVIPGGELMYADTLNMIGDTGAGKSSVALSIIANSPKTTEEADRTHVLQQCRMIVEEGMGRCIIINDFGGHDIYHSVMPIFLPTNGLIILVCNLVEQSLEEQVRKWMLTVLAKSKEFRLIIVGTHADLVTSSKAHEYLVTSDDQRSALEDRMKSLSSDFFKSAIDEVNDHITRLECRTEKKHVQNKLTALRDLRENLKRATVCVVTLSCAVADGGVHTLRDVVTRSLRLPHILPVRWCRFMTKVLNPAADCLYITIQEVERLSREHFTKDDDSNALTTILHYLVETSQIIWLANHSFLKDFIFHSPQKIIDTCKKMFHHDNVVLSSQKLYDVELNDYSQGILQEPLMRKLLSEQIENQNSCDVLHPTTYEVVVSFLQQCNLISYVRETDNGKQFIVPCKLIATEPQERLLEMEQKGSECLNRVSVRLSFIGSVIPLSLFETSLSSMLSVTGELSKHVVWPNVWKDGAIISHNGVTLITKRTGTVILLTAFSKPCYPSPWTVLHPVLKRLNDSVMASWHGAPPSCAIVCPWCERRKPSNAKVAEIKIDLTTLVADDRPNSDWLTCGICVQAIPRSLCLPTIKEGSFITDQREIETFFGVAAPKRRELSQNDGRPRKVPKQLESDGGDDAKCSELLRRLRKATPQLVQGLDRLSVEFVLDALRAARDGYGLITYDHCQEIQAESTDSGKVRKLLHIVGTRGDEAIQALAQSLKCDGVRRQDLAELILEPPFS